MDIMTLTRADGIKIQIRLNSIVRIRELLEFERRIHAASTRIDCGCILYVRESAEEVAMRTRPAGGRPNRFGKLVAPNGSPIWFQGRLAQGPLPVSTLDRKNGISSSLTIARQTQFVRNSPEEVHALIDALGGQALSLAASEISQSLPSGAAIEMPTRLSWESQLPLR
jgi:hypothetical protein